MLTSCPECNLQISDKAIQCPHCGYPIDKNAIQKIRNPTFNCCDTSRHNNYFMTYDKYRHRFEKIKVALNLNEAHRAHDGRAHFITMAKKYEVDEYAIKYIVGHEITDLTERVYTQRNIEWLKTEIEKIK